MKQVVTSVITVTAVITSAAASCGCKSVGSNG